ncbi:MAG: thioesterase family protein [Myxococcota bacterium]
MSSSEPARKTQPRQSFLEATTWAPVDSNRFAGHVDGSWGQGRAVFGGVVGAGMVRVSRHHVPDDRELRSASITFVGPVVAGALECETEVIREGKSASFVVAKLIQEGTTRALATTTYARARHSSVPVSGPPRPETTPVESIGSLPYIDGLMPPFTQWLETRYTEGNHPFSGSESSSIAGWFRFREDALPVDDAAMFGLIDAWPSPALTMLRVPVPGSSITWNVDLLTARPDCRLDEWWYFRAESSFVSDGYTSFDASLWAPDGQFVARSRQLAGIFERPPAG